MHDCTIHLVVAVHILRQRRSNEKGSAFTSKVDVNDTKVFDKSTARGEFNMPDFSVTGDFRQFSPRLIQLNSVADPTFDCSLG
jgi:hypothetical protein